MDIESRWPVGRQQTASMVFRQMKVQTRFAWAALAAACIWAAPGVHGSASAESVVVHVVLVWLKEAGNADHRQRIIDATRALADIPGVIQLHVGESVPSNREIVDDSFDVGLYFTFASVDDMRAYLVDPRHQAAVQEIFGPLSERYIAYDFEDKGWTSRPVDKFAE